LQEFEEGNKKHLREKDALVGKAERLYAEKNARHPEV